MNLSLNQVQHEALPPTEDGSMSAYINKGNEAVTNRQKVNKLRAVENPEQWLVVTVTNTVNATSIVGPLAHATFNTS